MRLAKYGMPLVALVAAPSAIAADMLPLKQGIFVPTDVACKGAPNSQIISYWGGKSAINASQTTCTIKTLNVKGQTYTIHDQCKDIASGGSFSDDPVTLTIASAVSFRMNGAAYRYCGPKVQF